MLLMADWLVDNGEVMPEIVCCCCCSWWWMCVCVCVCLEWCEIHHRTSLIKQTDRRTDRQTDRRVSSHIPDIPEKYIIWVPRTYRADYNVTHIKIEIIHIPNSLTQIPYFRAYHIHHTGEFDTHRINTTNSHIYHLTYTIYTVKPHIYTTHTNIYTYMINLTANSEVMYRCYKDKLSCRCYNGKIHML